MRDYGVYLVTDTQQCGGLKGVIDTVTQAVEQGVKIVQVRDKKAEARELLTLFEAVGEAVGQQATVLLDDRVDVYLAAKLRGAKVHGIHIGQDDIPVLQARKLIGADAILGLTANTPAHFRAIHQLPADSVDYLGVGAIRATQTKADHPEPLGVDGFKKLAASTTLPCIAIGGIQSQDLAPLKAAGAAGVAVVSAICKAADVTTATQSLIAHW